MAMEPYVPGGYATCRFRYTCAGVPKVMGTTLGVLVEPLDPDDVVEEMYISWNAHIVKDGARLGNAYTFQGVTLTMAHDFTADTIHEWNDPVVGSQGSPNVPPNCAILVAKRTAFIGRHYRGRMFLPAGHGVESEITDQGTLAGAIVTGMNNDFDSLLGAMGVDSINPVLFHQYDPVLLQEPLDPTPITALHVQSLLATQRRRLR